MLRYIFVPYHGPVNVLNYDHSYIEESGSLEFKATNYLSPWKQTNRAKRTNPNLTWIRYFGGLTPEQKIFLLRLFKGKLVFPQYKFYFSHSGFLMSVKKTKQNTTTKAISLTNRNWCKQQLEPIRGYKQLHPSHSKHGKIMGGNSGAKFSYHSLSATVAIGWLLFWHSIGNRCITDHKVSRHSLSKLGWILRLPKKTALNV